MASGSGRADEIATPDTIVHDIEATRARLAGTIDQIVERANPKNAAKRELTKLKARFIDDSGSPRLDAIAPVAGAVVGAVVLIVLIRKFVGRD
ncbi:MAG: DUF3618 domain-containing protein [Nocardioidaceae bacterium]